LPSFYWEASYERDFENSVTLTLENRLIDEFRPNFGAIRAEFPMVKSCYLAAFDPRVQLECCKQFSDVLIVSETLDYWIGRDRGGVFDVARHSNGFIVAAREFHELWGFEAQPQMSFRRFADVLESTGLDFLIITFADRGSQVVHPEGTFFVPAQRCVAVDATGAGNAYAGGVVGHLTQARIRDQAQLLDATALGTALAALQVQDFGNRVLREATSDDILALQREVRNSITWFDQEC